MTPDGLTPLMIAAAAQRDDAVAIVRALLGAGADSTLTDNQGRTAMDHAHHDRVRDLLRARMVELAAAPYVLK